MAVVVTLGVPLALSTILVFIIVGLALKNINAGLPNPIWCHESSIVALFGLLLGGIFTYATKTTISFDSDLFFYLVLPPIIFSAGYSLKRKKFFRFGVSITVFGIVGTILNFLMIALAARLFGVVYRVRQLSWSGCMLLGAVLSGTDEVSAMSFIRMKDFPQLGALIFGEGVLNDSLSIVLFKAINEASNHEQQPVTPQPDLLNPEDFLPSEPTFSPTQFPTEPPTELPAVLEAPVSAVDAFVAVSMKVMFQLVFSTCIGVACGLLCAFVLKHMHSMKSHPIHQTSLILVFGMLAYSVAECFGVSGIVTIFMAGVTMAHYAWYSLTHSAQVTTKVTLSSLSDMAEGFAFAYVGLSLWGYAKASFHIGFAVYMFVVVCLSRVLTIFGLCHVLASYHSDFRLPVKEKIGFVCGGIVRGCLCWGQILQLKNDDDMMLITTTLLIVMSTIVGCGILLPAIIPRLIPIPDKGSHRNRAAESVEMKDISLFPETHTPSPKPHQQAGALEDDSAADTVKLAGNKFSNHNLTMAATPVAEHPNDVSMLSDHEDPATTPRTHIKTRTEFSHPHNRLASLLHVLWVRVDENYMKPVFGGSNSHNSSTFSNTLNNLHGFDHTLMQDNNFTLNQVDVGMTIRQEILRRTAHMSLWYMLTHPTEVQQIFESDFSSNNNNHIFGYATHNYSLLYNQQSNAVNASISTSVNNANNYNTLTTSHTSQRSLLLLEELQEERQQHQESFDDEFMNNVVMDDELFELSDLSNRRYSQSPLRQRHPNNASTYSNRSGYSGRSGNVSLYPHTPYIHPYHSGGGGGAAGRDIGATGQGTTAPFLSPIHSKNTVTTPIRGVRYAPNNNSIVGQSSSVQHGRNGLVGDDDELDSYSSDPEESNTPSRTRQPVSAFTHPRTHTHMINDQDDDIAMYQGMYFDPDELAALTKVNSRLSSDPNKSNPSRGNSNNRDSIGEFFSGQLQGTISYAHGHGNNSSTSPFPTDVHEV